MEFETTTGARRRPPMPLIAARAGARTERLTNRRRRCQALPRPRGPGRPVEPGARRLSRRMARAAPDRLDQEINGVPRARVRAPVAMRPLLETAVTRWRRAASYAGRTLELRWRAGAVTVSGDAVELAAAVDNLLVNAIEHGGPRVLVEASV